MTMTEEVRKKFEEWHLSEYGEYGPEDFVRNEYGQYQFGQIEKRLKAFEAAYHLGVEAGRERERRSHEQLSSTGTRDQAGRKFDGTPGWNEAAGLKG